MAAHTTLLDVTIVINININILFVFFTLLFYTALEAFLTVTHLYSIYTLHFQTDVFQS